MDRGAQLSRLVEILARFTAYTSQHLPDDVEERLAQLRDRETTPLARLMYDAMFDNLAMARTLQRPCCQDTGIIQYYVQVGTRFPFIDELPASLHQAVIQATQLAPLRPNAVEVFDEKNTGNNVGTRVPWVEWQLIPDHSDLQVHTYLAGGGCSLPGIARVLTPAQGYEGVVQLVFDQVTSYGVNACPPLVVGIGLASAMEVAASLSKKALLRPVGSRNPHPQGAELETRLEQALNALHLGPGGFPGTSSVLAVHLEQAARHPATLAVGLSTGCWAHRRSLIRITADLEYETLSHKGAIL